MVYQTRKQISELGDKLPQEIKTQVEGKVAELEKVIAEDDIPKMKSLMDELQQEVMTMGQAVYSQQGTPPPSQQETATADSQRDKSQGADVIDADFTDKK